MGRWRSWQGLWASPGYALYRVTEDDNIPWHRVINAKGEVSRSPLRHGTDYLQQTLLEHEGIVFSAEGKINLTTYRWQPDPKLLAAAWQNLGAC
jgi:methylated-DNA-protein-cysteine methyltransferase-like protein